MKNSGKTLGDFVDGRVNNFDLLRLFAALLVLVSHSLVLAGEPLEPLVKLFGGYRTTSLGVYIFFVISGFLVAGSIERRTILEYFSSRFFRIVPALAVTVFVTALVVGPLFTSLSIGEYYQNKQVYNYLLNAIPYRIEFILPGVFVNLPFQNGVNGSLWTLPIELFCYTMLALIYLLGGRKLILVVPVALIVAILFLWNSITSELSSTVLFGMTMVSTSLQYGLMFAIGSILWIYRMNIPIDSRLAFICLVLLVAGTLSGYVGFFVYLWLPYSIIYLAYSKPVLQVLIAKVGDLSYGTYLFSFPVQQIIVSLCDGKILGWNLAIVSAVVSMMLAAVSWRLIEKPAINCKIRLFRDAKVAQT